MSKLGNICFQFANDCEEAVNQKAIERAIPSDTVPTIRHQLKRAKAMLLLTCGNVSEAFEVAKESVSVATSTTDIVNGLLTVQKCASYLPQDQGSDDATIQACTDALRQMQNESSTPDYKLIPLTVYIETGKLLINQKRFSEALDIMLFGCTVYASSSLFHLVGVCCMRLDRMVDAEDALQEANLLNNRNPEVWAFLSILCLETGSGRRTEEAQKSLQQSLRLGLTNVAILRELATCYIAVDQLQIAEDLVRRALACEEAAGGKVSSHTRRMLGDVLAGQNNAAKAIEEYQLVINDSATDYETKIVTAEKCIDLLNTLGRSEEAQILVQILDSMM
jgi:Flp pilus assembly protein TadD